MRHSELYANIFRRGTTTPLCSCPSFAHTSWVFTDEVYFITSIHVSKQWLKTRGFSLAKFISRTMSFLFPKPASLSLSGKLAKGTLNVMFLFSFGALKTGVPIVLAGIF